jgi:hypothetical protein
MAATSTFLSISLAPHRAGSLIRMDLTRLLTDAGFSDLRATVDSHAFTYSDLDAYWRVARSTGERRRLLSRRCAFDWRWPRLLRRISSQMRCIYLRGAPGNGNPSHTSRVGPFNTVPTCRDIHRSVVMVLAKYPQRAT